MLLWQSVKDAYALHGHPTPIWNFTITMGKSAALRKRAFPDAGSVIVSEAMLALLNVALFALHTMFIKRFYSSSGESLESRKTVSLLFMPKTKWPFDFKDFRGIARLDRLAKLYMACVIGLAKQRIPFQSKDTCNRGFKLRL